jgi:hypothetical protein
MTVTIIRPNGIAISSHAITIVGGGSANGAVSDGADDGSGGADGTYIKAQVDHQYIRFTLEDIGALNANQRIKSVGSRIRTARDSGGGACQATNTWLNSSAGAHLGTCPFIAQLTVTRCLTAILTNAGPVSYKGPCGKPWSRTSVNDLQQMVVWYKPASGTVAFQRVYETYVDVDINEQPFVSGAPIVTNFTNNATPQVDWTYADNDDDPQTAYQVKIFDSATYGGANFNADTTLPTWWSKILNGNGSSVTVATPLQNGVTYQAYVRVAQNWPGPVDTGSDKSQAGKWWSNWAISAPFTVTFTLPYAPVISAQVLADTNQYRALVSALVPYNLLSDDNASFEGTIGNWVALTNMAPNYPARSTVRAADGIASMRMQSAGAGDMVAKCNPDLIGDPVVDGNQAYVAVASFSASGTGRACAVGVDWLDSTGASISGATYGTSINDVTGGPFTQAVFSATSPANARNATLRAKVIGCGAANEIHWVDKIDMHAAGPSGGWMPGSYLNDQGDLVIERGEYLLDDRGPADNWFHPQVASAGSVLQNQGYGFWIDTTQGSLSWKWLDKLIPVEGDTPPGMLDWHPGTATTPSIAFGFWFYGGTAYMVPVVQGQQHILAFWAWVDTGTFVLRPRIDWRDADGNITGAASTGPDVTLTTTPQRVIAIGTPPAGALLASGAAMNVNSDAGKHVYFTRFGFGLGTLPLDGRRAKGQPTGVSLEGKPLGLAWTEIRATEPVPDFTLPPGFNFGQDEAYPDYEYVPGRPTLYRAHIAYSVGTNVIRSPDSNTVVVYAAPPAVSLLRSVTQPTLQVAVNRRKAAPYSIAEDANVYHPLGADGATPKVRDWVGGEDGQLLLFSKSEAQRARINDLLYAPETLQVQWAQGGRTYINITSRSIAELISADLDVCDVDGGPISDHIRYDAYTLDYVETVAP